MSPPEGCVQAAVVVFAAADADPEDESALGQYVQRRRLLGDERYRMCR
ncbi:Uncharacterised protein [Mycobacteroides abscessus]|nr:Uncharacterised protein [Mycobacteroides abscessus]SHR32082.1 Uncharacterised protein [Mycobacteroides abscessus subsp. abscessus]SHT28815.1 Uncharacterised protein [Mycobacteroides abscessus subsp. abscessus]SHW68395.1 Uncharacterised protein [Mycobacteroides abscessus subsp. abscessus]SIC99416.1 Uncharacterised protein [Mycobacteroides abscessus subsp. abscessus]